MDMPAVLDAGLIEEVVHSFPDSGRWRQTLCKRLRDPRKTDTNRRRWELLNDADGKGGLYAFLVPSQFFNRHRHIRLHGPSTREISFSFSAEGTRLVGDDDDQFIIYVGRSTNLLGRLKGHFSLAEKSTVAQVRKGLFNSGICKDSHAAVSFMLNHATIAWHVLDGDKHVANRDIIEVALWAKFMSPFNIKSER